MSEQPLSGGELTDGVVRVGDTVRRPAGPNVDLMRDVLLHLERCGFDAAPRWLGFDEHDRVVLSWIPGETFADRSRLHPYLGDPKARIAFTDEQVDAAFRLLRRYHDTFDGDVVCHGDFGPWNLVWREALPVAMLDFDNAHHGEAGDDVGYALRMFVAYGLAETSPEELVDRTRNALAAYGADFDVAALLDREYDRAEARCRRNGWDRQLERLPIERAWLAAHGGRF